MNRTRFVLGLLTSLGLGAAAACGSTSSGNGATPDNGADASSSSSGGTSGTGSDAGGTGCPSGQSLCIGLLGNSCIDAGAACLGTAVMANECSATNPCPGSQVCCSSIVGADGGALVVTDAGGGGLGAGLNVAVQCMSACPGGGALSSQVCVLEPDGGSPTACPNGTSCMNYPLAIATPGLPSTLCLAPTPTYDGGYPRYDAGTMSGEDSGPGVVDAAPETVDTGVNDASSTAVVDAASE